MNPPKLRGGPSCISRACAHTRVRSSPECRAPSRPRPCTKPHPRPGLHPGLHRSHVPRRSLRPVPGDSVLRTSHRLPRCLVRISTRPPCSLPHPLPGLPQKRTSQTVRCCAPRRGLSPALLGSRAPAPSPAGRDTLPHAGLHGAGVRGPRVPLTTVPGARQPTGSGALARGRKEADGSWAGWWRHPCGRATQTSRCRLLRTYWRRRAEPPWPRRRASRISAKLSVLQEAFRDQARLLGPCAALTPAVHGAARGLVHCHQLWLCEGRYLAVPFGSLPTHCSPDVAS